MRTSITPLLIAAVLATVSPSTAASPPPVAPAFKTWSGYLSGTWNCHSGKTPYTVTYKQALGGRWIRGINTSGSSQSEDMLAYDGRKQMWTLYDMEPAGTSSHMTGSSDSRAIKLSDKASHFSLALQRINADEYHLQFFAPNGKPSGTPDLCRRSH